MTNQRREPIDTTSDTDRGTTADSDTYRGTTSDGDTYRGTTSDSDTYRGTAPAPDTYRGTVPATRHDGSPDVVQSAAFVAPRDSVRWGPIVAGLVTALSIFLLLSLLALGLGLTAADAANAGEDAGPAAGIMAAVIGLLSFVIGGFVAGRASAVGGRGAGALNGFLVWALGITAILLLAANGLGQVLGGAGEIFGQLQQTNVEPNVEVNPAEAANAVRNSALVGFASLALPALAAAIGGAMGARREDDIVETTR